MPEAGNERIRFHQACATTSLPNRVTVCKADPKSGPVVGVGSVAHRRPCRHRASSANQRLPRDHLLQRLRHALRCFDVRSRRPRASSTTLPSSSASIVRRVPWCGRHPIAPMACMNLTLSSASKLASNGDGGLAVLDGQVVFTAGNLPVVKCPAADEFHCHRDLQSSRRCHRSRPRRWPSLFVPAASKSPLPIVLCSGTRGIGHRRHRRHRSSRVSAPSTAETASTCTQQARTPPA